MCVLWFSIIINDDLSFFFFFFSHYLETGIVCILRWPLSPLLLNHYFAYLQPSHLQNQKLGWGSYLSAAPGCWAAANLAPPLGGAEGWCLDALFSTCTCSTAEKEELASLLCGDVREKTLCPLRAPQLPLSERPGCRKDNSNKHVTAFLFLFFSRIAPII